MEKKTGASTRAWIKIDLQGADSAHYQQMMQRETRRISHFPDGVDRLITMERRWWDAYDTVHTAWRIGDEHQHFVFDLVANITPVDHPEFERDLHCTFVMHIRKGWRVYNEKKRTIANTR